MSQENQTFLISKSGLNGPAFRWTEKYLGSNRRKNPSIDEFGQTRLTIDPNIVITQTVVQTDKGKIIRDYARPKRSPSSPKSKVVVTFIPTDENDYLNYITVKNTRREDIDKNLRQIEIAPTRKTGAEIAIATLGAIGTEVAKNRDIETARSTDPKGDKKNVTDYMLKTRYWSGDQKQEVTPDLLKISPDTLDQIKLLINLETQFINRVAKNYIDDVANNRNTRLVQLIEGPFQNTAIMETARKWCLAVNPNSSTNYFRPDLGLRWVDDRKVMAFLCEVNIITAGTPPAMLYREAQNPPEPASGGTINFLRKLGINVRSELAIVGVSPLKSNQQLYEDSHLDMAEMISKQIGANTGYTKITDLEIKDSLLFLPNSNKPITDIYWRIPPFQTETLGELNSPQGQLLLDLYSNQKVQIFPKPILPFMNNKVLEVLVWDSEFNYLVPLELKKFIPETVWANLGNDTCQQIISGILLWQDYVIKKCRGDGGVMLGCETPKEEFNQQLKIASQTEFDYVVQKFIEPVRQPFRISKANGQWSNKPFYLRIEPTIGITNSGNPEITELFVTGSPTTRKVGGNEKSIMGTIVVSE